MSAAATTTFEELDPAALSATNADSSKTTAGTGTTTGATGAASGTTDAGGTGTAAGASSTSIAVTDPSAAEQLRQLADLGITPQNAQEWTEKGQTLESLAYMLANNPKEFFASIERINPQGHKKLLDTAADIYLDRLPPEQRTGSTASSTAQTGADSELAREVKRLTQQVETITAQRRQEEGARQYNATKAAYQTKVNEIMGTEVVKKMGLDATEEEYVRLAVDKSIGADQASLNRINKGVLVDVATHVTRALNKVGANRTAKNTTATTAREAVGKNGSIGDEVSAGATAVNGVVSQPEDSWEGTEQAFARDLDKSRAQARR